MRAIEGHPEAHDRHTDFPGTSGFRRFNWFHSVELDPVGLARHHLLRSAVTALSRGRGVSVASEVSLVSAALIDRPQ